MIAEFLRQEYAHHARYGPRIDECLRAEDVSTSIVISPNLGDPVENADRRRVFGCYRGYGAGGYSYLTDFPDSGVVWSWVALSPDELLDSVYIRFAYWTELSQGTRAPRVAADRIRSGDFAGSDLYQFYVELAARLRSGLSVPPVILVSADDGKTRIILEGHTRVTAFALAPEAIPEETHVILGASPDIAKWDEY